jgi:membrane protease YdiL (CAAX protease family)
MSYSSRQLSAANPLPTIGSAPLFSILSKQVNISLLMETAAITIIAIAAIKVFGASFIFKQTWFVTPAILIAAAFIPTAINKRDFARFGFKSKQIRHSLALLGWACIVTLPLMVFGLWLMRYWGLELPLRAVMPPAQRWFSWLFYQFMYVAVAEEVFFRGYVQNNILKSTRTLTQEQIVRWGLPHHKKIGGLKPTLLSIIISAVIFAAAHTLIQGELMSVLTFLPGLVLGWLFVRTRSLLAPILFHGLANVSYLCVAAMLI